MSKVISYALFGYDKAKHPDCFDFNSLLRGLSVNIRLARLVYPGWQVHCALDRPSYEAHKEYFDELCSAGALHIEVLNTAPLCEGMLWRLRPVFVMGSDGFHTHSHVICRDLDSPLTYREHQCVQDWINKDKCAHAMTDSISHNIPLMGGMVGFIPKHFSHLVGIGDFKELIARGGINLSEKGTDQTLMMNVIYPRIAQRGQDSITQHYMLGIPNTFLSDFHNTIPDINLSDVGVPDEMKESNDACYHLGMSGYYEIPTWRFLRKYSNRFEDIDKAEQHFKEIFHWQLVRT